MRCAAGFVDWEGCAYPDLATRRALTKCKRDLSQFCHQTHPHKPMDYGLV
jgi:hypothetical protein